MVNKLITTLLIFIFLLLAIVGLQILSGGSNGGAQVISHNMVFLFSPKDLVTFFIEASVV